MEYTEKTNIEKAFKDYCTERGYQNTMAIADDSGVEGYVIGNVKASEFTRSRSLNEGGTLFMVRLSKKDYNNKAITDGKFGNY